MGEHAWRVETADCRDVLGGLPEEHVLITDPPWPCETGRKLAQGEDPGDLLRAALEVSACRRAVIWLGCMSDPRVLMAVPSRLPFVRACWLRYALPSYCGTILNSGDVAYVFGDPHAPRGDTVMPGEVTASRTGVPRGVEAGDQPTPRRIEHALWLVRWMSSPGDLIVDPFCGSGTILVAALRLGRRAVGIEIEPRWAEQARERCQAESQETSLQAARAGQMPLFGGTDG
jgi:hypothetical protein